MRGGLALAAVVVGFASFSQTLGYQLRNADPERAHRLASGDGRVTALLAQQRTAGATDREKWRRVYDVARLALREDPTAVAAVVALGLATQVGGDAGRARRLFTYAEHLSRRDLPTQLWLVEAAVAKGQVRDALRHYDIALRTSRQAPDLLFPVLSSALSEGPVRTALARTLADQPSWGSGFVDYAADNAPEPRAVGQLLEILNRVKYPVSERARAATVARLMAQGMTADAWHYYSVVTPGADRRRLRDPRFETSPTIPTLFDWTPLNENGVTASIQPAIGGGVVDFAAPASVGGPVLQQIQLLPPGDYRLTGHTSGIDESANAPAYWLLACKNGREVGRILLSGGAPNRGAFSGLFTVPADCPEQKLQLVVQATDAVGGVAGQLNHVQLRPMTN